MRQAPLAFLNDGESTYSLLTNRSGIVLALSWLEEPSSASLERKVGSTRFSLTLVLRTKVAQVYERSAAETIAEPKRTR